MKPPPRRSIDGLDLITHHPQEQIDAVDALVHQAPTVFLPRPPPWSLGIIFPIPIPADVNRAMAEFPETSRFKRFSRLLNRNVESVLMAYGDFHPHFLCSFDDSIGIGKTHRDRLFDDDVAPVIDAGNGDFGMLSAFGRDADKIRLQIFQHPFVIMISGDGGIGI